MKDRQSYPRLVGEGLTPEKAQSLTFGTVLYHRHWRNADGTPQRWRVNGSPRTWKRRVYEDGKFQGWVVDSRRVDVPLKRGLREYDYLYEGNIEDFTLDEEEAM